MIIVIGEPRSGTSLMMQTLVLLGFVPLGTKFPIYRAVANNPLGYWEHEDFYANMEIRNVQDDGDQCVKINLRKFLDNPRIGIGNKIIICTRNLTQLANAQITTGISENFDRTLARVTRNYQRASNLIAAHPEVPVLQIALNTFRAQPVATVDAIIAFAPPPTRGRQAAINNVAGGGE